MLCGHDGNKYMHAKSLNFSDRNLEHRGQTATQQCDGLDDTDRMTALKYTVQCINYHKFKPNSYTGEMKNITSANDGVSV